jgi:hypothetical protein
MALPYGQELGSALAARDPVNTDAPGLQDNKNGPPGLAGNHKGPPIAPPVALPTTSATVGPPTLASQNSPPETRVSSSTIAPLATAPSTLPPTTSSTLLTTSTTEVPPSLKSSSVTATSVAVSPSIYYETSPISSTQSFVETTLRTTSTGTSITTALPTGLVPFPPSITVQSGHDTLGPGQEAGIAVGTIGVFNLHLTIMIYFLDTDNRAAGFIFILTLMFLLFKWRKGELPQWLSCLRRSLPGKVGNSRWPSRSLPAPDMSDSLLTAEAGSRDSLGWDYRSTFAQPNVREKSRRSLPRSLRRLVRFNPLGQNPVSPHPTGEGTSSRNSFASFFRRRSAASTSRSMIDVESPPSLPPLPSGLPLRPPAAMSVPSNESVHSNVDGSLRPQTMSSEILPPDFHRSWRYRNSQTTIISEESETRSFKSVPGWVKFHYPRISRNDGGGSRESYAPLPAPQAISPGSWLKAKILRRSQSTTASGEKEEPCSESDTGEELASTESPVLGPSGCKQAWHSYRASCESADGLVAEKQEPWQI